MTVTSVLTALLALAPQPAGLGQAPRGEALLKADMLAAHNDVRAILGQAPLDWDPALEADAASHARRLAARDSMEHARQPASAEPQGENLWMGSRGAFTHKQMVTTWTDEAGDYVPGPFPEVSRTGVWQDVGHYTQIIWHATTRVGCAIASSDRFDYLVCRYLPVGNIDGAAPIGR